jgi:hypothetical protein
MYQVRFIKRGGMDSLIYVTSSLGEAEDMVSTAAALDHERAEVWCDGKCIKIVSHPDLSLPKHHSDAA